MALHRESKWESTYKRDIAKNGSIKEQEIVFSFLRLTLHCNCRNTTEIARTSATSLKDKKNKAIKPVTAFSWFEPVKPKMHIIADKSRFIEILEQTLKELTLVRTDFFRLLIMVSKYKKPLFLGKCSIAGTRL